MKHYLDKLFHFVISAIIVAVLMCITKDIAMPVLITLLVCIIKELYDEYSEGGTGASWADFVADILGIITGVTLFLTL